MLGSSHMRFLWDSMLAACGHRKANRVDRVNVKQTERRSRASHCKKHSDAIALGFTFFYFDVRFAHELVWASPRASLPLKKRIDTPRLPPGSTRGCIVVQKFKAEAIGRRLPRSKRMSWGCSRRGCSRSRRSWCSWARGTCTAHGYTPRCCRSTAPSASSRASCPLSGAAKSYL